MKEELVKNELDSDRFSEVLLMIDDLIHTKKDTILIAIDGKCASGKTTLGNYIYEKYDCNLFHMDDFFLRQEQRTKERMKEIGGNVDYERFLDEVLLPIQRKESVYYRPFSCKTFTIAEGIHIPYRRINIIEGSYSMHPYFGDLYDCNIFLDLKEEEQINRIRLRNGEAMLSRFVNEWIPKENAYFEKYQIANHCFVILTDHKNKFY